MIKRRAAAARVLPPSTCCHTFRATGITAYLSTGGTLEHAQQIAGHASPKTTKLYDRTADTVTVDEIERIVFSPHLPMLGYRSRSALAGCLLAGPDGYHRTWRRTRAVSALDDPGCSERPEARPPHWGCCGGPALDIQAALTREAPGDA